MATLKEQAEELGIDVDGRWSDEKLQRKIDDAIAAKTNPPAEKPAEPKKVGDVPVRLKFDYWDSAGERHASGKVMEVPVEDAKKLLAEKKAERADPLPGES